MISTVVNASAYDLSQARRALLARCWQVLLELALKSTVEELKANPPEDGENRDCNHRLLENPSN